MTYCPASGMGIRLGAIGLGGLGNVELALYDEMDDVEIVAGADVSLDARESFEAAYDATAYEDYESTLANHDLDAVTVVTPHTLHYEQTIACFEAGVDVFLEKPMVTGVADAVDLVETARESGRVLQVGYQRHFDSLFVRLRSVVASGRIGDVHAVNAYLGQNWIETQRGSWRTNPGLSGGGQLYDSGSHLLDAVLWTLDAEPRTVAAVTDRGGEDVDVNSALAATLDRDGDTVTASIGVVGDGTNGSPDDGLVVWGTEGHVEYDGESVTVYEDGVVSKASITDSRDFETLTRHKLADFVAAVREGTEPSVPGSFGLQVTAFTEAAYEAAESGETVDVPALIERARTERDAERELAADD